jgi:poly(3-hydroxybutyrate) depolymerase
MLASTLFSVLGLSAVGVSSDVPVRIEQEALVAEYLALPAYSREGHGRGLELLASLGEVPFPNKRELKRWEGYFAKHAKTLPRLPTKAGETFDLGEGRGRYFLAGQLKRPSALFVGLHGGGVGAGDASSSRGMYAEALTARGWLGIFPEVLEKTERGWTDSGTEEWVLSLIDRAIDTFEIDPANVFLGGHSMGGYGSWVIGADHPDRFAALLPSAGAPSFVMNRSRGTIHVQKGVIPNLRNTPMCVFQSTDDPKVGPEANQAAVRDLEAARERWGGFADFEYWEVADRGHGLPEGGSEALLAKIEGYSRNAVPTHLVWQPRVDWKEQFYWLLWEGGAEVKGTVIAEVDRVRGSVDVRLERTQGKGLCVLLSEALVDMEREVTVFVNGIKAFEGVPQPDFATWVRGRALRDPGRAYSARIPLHLAD